MTSDTAKRKRWTTLAIRVWAIIGILLLVAVGGAVVGRLAPALTPFVIGLVLIVLLRGPVERLAVRGVPRALAVAICYVVAAAVVAVGMLVVLPVFAHQVGAFAVALPGDLDRAFKIWSDVTAPKGTPIVPSWITTAVLNLKDSAVSSLGSWSSGGLSVAFAAGSQVVTLVFNLLMALIIAFYTLMDLPKIREEIFLLLPRRFHDEATHVSATVSRILGGWMRGALLDALIVGVLIGIGLTLLGIPYGFAIGIIGGALNIVPYLGPVVAAVLAGFSGLFENPWRALFAVLVVMAVQQIDGLLLNPRIMAKNVDLHPVLVVFSLLTGATLFGITGMLLAVPVAAIGKGLFVYYFERRTQQSLRTEDGALFRTQPGAQDGSSDADAPAEA